MPEHKLTQEEFGALSPEQQRRYVYERNKENFKPLKVCHRRSRSHLIFAVTEAPAGLITPGGQPAGGQQVPVPFDALVPCMEEVCMLWDSKKGRCLDRSAAIAAAYGKDEAGKQES
jgi:hypothetical protein